MEYPLISGGCALLQCHYASPLHAAYCESGPCVANGAVLWLSWNSKPSLLIFWQSPKQFELFWVHLSSPWHNKKKTICTSGLNSWREYIPIHSRGVCVCKCKSLGSVRFSMLADFKNWLNVKNIRSSQKTILSKNAASWAIIFSPIFLRCFFFQMEVSSIHVKNHPPPRGCSSHHHIPRHCIRRKRLLAKTPKRSVSPKENTSSLRDRSETWPVAVHGVGCRPFGVERSLYVYIRTTKVTHFAKRWLHSFSALDKTHTPLKPNQRGDLG